jgi:hypothetical protein
VSQPGKDPLLRIWVHVVGEANTQGTVQCEALKQYYSTMNFLQENHYDRNTVQCTIAISLSSQIPIQRLKNAEIHGIVAL